MIGKIKCYETKRTRPKLLLFFVFRIRYCKPHRQPTTRNRARSSGPHTHTAPAGSPPGPSFHTCNGAAATTRNPRALPQDGAERQPTNTSPCGTRGRSPSAGSNSFRHACFSMAMAASTQLLSPVTCCLRTTISRCSSTRSALTSSSVSRTVLLVSSASSCSRSSY